jgi:hypothetical protein
MKREVWPWWKFPPYTHQEMGVMALASLAGADLLGSPGYAALDKEETRDKWVLNNHTELLKLLNGLRSYVNQRLRKVVLAKLIKDKGACPSLEKILGCATRDKAVIDLDDPNDLGIADWYYEQYLPRSTADAKTWPPTIRHYKIISEAFTQHNKDLLCITPETEAYAVVSYDNFLDAYKEQYRLLLENPGMKLRHIKNREGLSSEDHILDPDGEHLLMVHEKYSGKWTKNDGGSDQDKGWLVEGMQRFGEILGMVAKARGWPKDNRKASVAAAKKQKEACLAFERKYLDKKRNALGIKEGSQAATALRKRFKTNEDSVPCTWGPISTFSLEDMGVFGKPSAQAKKALEEGGWGDVDNNPNSYKEYQNSGEDSDGDDEEED